MATTIISSATHRESRTIGGDTVLAAYPETKAQYVVVEDWRGRETTLANVLGDLDVPVFDSGITVSGGANISGGLTVEGEETHSGPAAFQSGIEVSGGITLATSAGNTGIPATAASNTSKFLRGDGTWANVSAAIPAATTSSLGGVIVGSGISVDSDGVISVSGSGYTLPPATTASLGGVIVGSGLGVTSTGKISVAGSYATSANVSAIISSGGYVTSMYVAGATVASAGNATTVNGKTVSANVPAAAEFTDSKVKAVKDNDTMVYLAGTTTNGASAHTTLTYHGDVYISSGGELRAPSMRASAFSGTATNASSLCGVAASGYVLASKMQRGSSVCLNSGTSKGAGTTWDVSATWSAFADPPQVFAQIRGGSGAFAQNMNVGVFALTSSGCTFRVRNVGGSAFTTSGQSVIDWMAVHF